MAGAAAAAAGLVTVPFVIIAALGASAAHYERIGAIRHVLAGITLAAIGLTLSMVWQTGRKTLRGLVPFALCAATTLASALLRLPLWTTMLVLGPVGIGWSYVRTAAAAPSTARVR